MDKDDCDDMCYLHKDLCYSFARSALQADLNSSPSVLLYKLHL